MHTDSEDAKAQLAMEAQIVAKEKEIQPMVQKESDLYRKKITEFENEMKTYQGGLKKEAYYFYQSGLELATKRLDEVTKDLNRFDERMNELHHIASNFGYAEDMLSPYECAKGEVNPIVRSIIAY